MPIIDYNTATVLAGTGLLGMAAGVIGSFAVLRRRALLGDALSHAALPGICLAFLLVEERIFSALLAGAFASAITGMAAIAAIRRWTRTKEDAAIGIVLSVFFGAGVVLLKWIQNTAVSGSKAGLQSFIFGKTAGMIASDVQAIALLVILMLAAVMVLYKEFKLVSFDPDFAAAQGWPAGILDTFILGLLTLTIVVGLPAVGVVLMAAMLILPAAAARFWTERLGMLLAAAGGLGLVTGTAGTLLSSRISAVDLPTGPTVVLVGAALFAVSMAIAPRRGVLARALRRRRLAVRTWRQNFLRAAYEVIEAHSAPELPERVVEPVFDLEEVAERRGWSLRLARRVARTLENAGLVRPAARRGWMRLTARGLHEALEVVRRHRLWELYLIRHADVAADHVDRDADMVEHVLPPELIGELEEDLRRSGEAVAGRRIPQSPHRLVIGSRDARDRGGGDGRSGDAAGAVPAGGDR